MSTPHAIRTWLTERLGLRYPIVQAPMAGGPATPALVAAVGRAGALGSFGFAYTDPDAMREQVRVVRTEGPLPIHINLFVDAPPPEPDDAELRAALAALLPMYEELGIAVPSAVAAPYAPDLAQQIEAALELRPAVLSSHFGPFPPAVIERARAQGTLIAATATGLDDALKLEAQGVDAVIAQGAEAGGHRGTFDTDAADPMIGTLGLVRLLVRRCRLPVIAAGGIMDGEGLAAALALGACAVQMGTAFLPADECGAPDAHKQALFERADAGTTLTRAFSGRPARAIRNAYIERAHADRIPLLPFPIQNKATGPMRAAAARQGDGDYLSLWAGQAYGLSRRGSAAQIVARIVAEYDAATQALVRAARG